ncbi:hypothetical protein GCM10008929_13430 [Alkalibacterium psychrotolerans]
MMIDNRVLLKEKKEHFLDMLDRLVNWDQSAESAQEIIDQNQETIQEIGKIDEQLSSEEREDFAKSNRWLVEQVISIQKRLIAILQKESKKVEGQMKQMNQKNKVVSHYMDKETSLFVDRDV